MYPTKSQAKGERLIICGTGQIERQGKVLLMLDRENNNRHNLLFDKNFRVNRVTIKTLIGQSERHRTVTGCSRNRAIQISDEGRTVLTDDANPALSSS